MIDCNFIKAASVDEAVSLLAEYKDKAKLIAGGTDVMVDLRYGRQDFQHLIDISGVESLSYIQEDGECIKIGATTTHSKCVKSGLLREKAGILAEACSRIGSPQIRNRGTVGGNIVTAAACADTVPALTVLDARCLLNSSRGQREVSLSEFIKGPNITGIASEEVLVEIYFKKPDPNAKSVFIKLGRRKALDKARLTIAVLALTGNDKRAKDVRIAVGSVTPSPCRFTEAEAQILNRVPCEALYRDAGEKVSERMIAESGYRWSTEYKKPVIEALTARALRQVFEA